MIFKTEPTDFNKKFDVVACYVQHDGKFVLLQRQPHKSRGNQWGLPAGKIDEGETKEQAMVREIHEETGLEVQENELEYFETIYVRPGDTDIVYHTFSIVLPDRPEIKIRDSEHQSFVWVSTEESLKMDLVHDLDECNKMFYKIS